MEKNLLALLRSKGYRRGMRVKSLNHVKDNTISCNLENCSIFYDNHGGVTAIFGAMSGFGGPMLYHKDEGRWAVPVLSLNTNIKVI